MFCQVHSLEFVDEAKTVCRRGAHAGQGASCQACWKLVVETVRAREDAISRQHVSVNFDMFVVADHTVLPSNSKCAI